MPKIKESETQVKDRLYRAEILKGMEIMNIDTKRLASVLGMSMPTMRKKIREPGTQTIVEARRICRILHIDPENFGLYI